MWKAGGFLGSKLDLDKNDIIDKAESIDDGLGNLISALSIKDAIDKKHAKLSCEGFVNNHSQNTDLYLNTVATKILYVDKNRGDSYTETGSFTKPFKTIQSAIDKVISNGDNSNLIPYTIKILNGGNYSDVTLNSDKLTYLTIDGCDIVNITNFSITGYNNFKCLYLHGLSITNFTATGFENNSECFTYDFGLDGCAITGTLAVKNVNCFGFSGSKIVVTLAEFENVGWNWATGDSEITADTFKLTWDANKNKPAGYSYTTTIYEASNIRRTPVLSGGNVIQLLVGARFGAAGTNITLISGQTLLNVGFVVCGVINSGGTFINYGSYIGYTHNSGTLTNNIKAISISNDSTVSGTSTKDALNTLNSGKADKVGSGDIEITDTIKGVILKSPDTNRWRITIDNTGLLTTTKIV